ARAASEHRPFDVGAEHPAQPCDDLAQRRPRLHELDGDRHEIGGRLAGLSLQPIEQARDEGRIAAAPHLREALDLARLDDGVHLVDRDRGRGRRFYQGIDAYYWLLARRLAPREVVGGVGDLTLEEALLDRL